MNHKQFVSGIAFVLFTVVFGLLAPDAFARPEFATRDNKPCWQCHVSPTGGGVRNATGFFSGQNASLEATNKWLDKKYAGWDDFAPVINEKIQLGTDMRVMFHDDADDPDIPNDQETAASSTFYLMQSAFYVNAQPLPILNIVGAYDAAQNTIEAYGMFDNLPAGIYMRVGRFMPPYGLRMEDHTLYTRQGIGFRPNGLDTGFELGIRPGPVYLLAAVTNGNMGDQAQNRDGNYYAVTAGAGVRFWKLALGTSFFHNTVNELQTNIYGGHATFGFWKISLLGEADFINAETELVPEPDQVTRVRVGSAAFAELDFQIIRGFDFQARYAHTDPNWEVQDDFRQQYMGGIVLYPVPYFSTYLQYRVNREHPDFEVADDEMMILAHFYF